MNKLTVFALLVCTLVAVGAGLEEDPKVSMDSEKYEENSISRSARESKRNDEEKGDMENGKVEKKDPIKKKTKLTKKLKKKEDIEKDDSDNVSQGKRKIKRKKKKGKNGQKKNIKYTKEKKEKRKNVIKSRKNKRRPKSTQRQASCSSDEKCLANATKYMKQTKDNVRNFVRQKNRIEKFLSLSKAKAGKKGEFSSDLVRLKEAGGGNASSLTCQGKESGEGQTALKDTVDKLAACQEDIEKACETDAPSYDKAEADACAIKMTALATAVDECVEKSECSCWNADDIKTASDAIADCSLTETNVNFIQLKNLCSSSFAACRKTQDSASSILFACNAGNSAGSLVSKLKIITDNKASLDALKTTATSKASGTRIKRATTCTEFITNSGKVAEMAAESISNPAIKQMADSINADPPTSCTVDEKAALTSTIITSLDSAITIADGVIAVIQNDLTVQTGSTASAAVINAAESSVTKAPTKRRNLKSLFNI